MKTGGIEFISEQQRVDFDNQLISMANQLLSLTKAVGNNSKDYDYNCLIGGVRTQLNRLSSTIDNLRLNDIESVKAFPND